MIVNVFLIKHSKKVLIVKVKNEQMYFETVNKTHKQDKSLEESKFEALVSNPYLSKLKSTTDKSQSNEEKKIKKDEISKEENKSENQSKNPFLRNVKNPFSNSSKNDVKSPDNSKNERKNVWKSNPFDRIKEHETKSK